MRKAALPILLVLANFFIYLLSIFNEQANHVHDLLPFLGCRCLPHIGFTSNRLEIENAVRLVQKFYKVQKTALSSGTRYSRPDCLAA